MRNIKNLIKCKICNKECNDIRGLAIHISKYHNNINKEEYYLSYISKDKKIGICNNENCNNKTRFNNLSKGYLLYCCFSCSTSSDNVQKKMKKSSNLRYGTDYPTQSKIIKDKTKKTNIERYGYCNPFKNKQIRELRKNTILNKYNCTNVFQSEKIKNKIKQTCLNKYGVENPSKSNEIKKKKQQNSFKTTFNKLLNSNRLNDIVIPNFKVEDYNGKLFKYNWKCMKCNNTFIDDINNGKVPRCPICYPKSSGTSNLEKEVFLFINQYFSDSVKNDRSIIFPSELDVYIPSKQFAIEFDGLYWHSELNGKDKNYHLNKTIQCSKKNIRLIHIFEDEWINKQSIIKSIIKSKLGLINNKIFARKCTISEVNNKNATTFLNDNHLQGYINGNHIGLYYNNELVSLLTTGKPRFNKNYDLEILRFCNQLNTIVIGGLSKLINNLNHNSIISYVDRRFGTGYGYEKCGFTKITESKPSYYYININNGSNNRINRINFQKHKLSKLLEHFDPRLTEWQNMQLSGYDRIWDCGNFIYEFKK